MAAKIAAGVAAAAVVTAVATGERWNWTVAAVAAVPRRGVLQRGRERPRRHGRRWRREGKRRGQWRGLRLSIPENIELKVGNN